MKFQNNGWELLSTVLLEGIGFADSDYGIVDNIW